MRHRVRQRTSCAVALAPLVHGSGGDLDVLVTDARERILDDTLVRGVGRAPRTRAHDEPTWWDGANESEGVGEGFARERARDDLLRVWMCSSPWTEESLRQTTHERMMSRSIRGSESSGGAYDHARSLV